MIDAAWRLIAERGLEGMAIREVLARTGAPRGSVYHYFPNGRAELIQLAIDRSRRWMVEQLIAAEPATPADVITAYLDIWRRVLEGTNFQVGCAVAGLITGATTGAERDRAKAAFAEIAEELAREFERTGVPAALAGLRAMVLVCVAEGAVLVCRARQDIGPLNIVGEQLRADWAI